jgi:hypothetical protein
MEYAETLIPGSKAVVNEAGVGVIEQELARAVQNRRDNVIN